MVLGSLLVVVESGLPPRTVRICFWVMRDFIEPSTSSTKVPFDAFSA